MPKKNPLPKPKLPKVKDPIKRKGSPGGPKTPGAKGTYNNQTTDSNNK